MYQSIYRDPSTYEYYLRDDEEGWSKFLHRGTFYKEHSEGEVFTLDGKKVIPTQKYNKEDPFLYEKDVDKYTRVLIDKYFESDEVPSFQNLVYLDIECEIGGALTPENIKAARTPITSIALYDNNSKKYYCYILDKEGNIKNEEKKGYIIVSCPTEKNLLEVFLEKWIELDATVISGWNSEYFDIPYMYHRMVKVLGEYEALKLSPLKKVYTSFRMPKAGEFTTSENGMIEVLNLAGINHLDYMNLFKKFITKQEPSYKLNDIGVKYVKLAKIEYEGTLDDLFRDDVDKFIKYNIRDVEILVELEKKLAFITLAITICHLCHVPYQSIFYSTDLNDGAILTYLKRENIVSPNKPTTINPNLRFLKEEYAGGYLKEPIPGLYEWVIDLDFTSLYPSIIRSLNLGLETLLGRIINVDKYGDYYSLKDLKKKDPNENIEIGKLDKFRNESISTLKVGELIEFIEENNLTISASGALFRNDVDSIVCKILEDWFNKRVHYKGLMKKAYNEGNKELGEFYHRLQMAYKIKLNDVYGSYAINTWRYTDGHKILSKAITLLGQRLTKESITFVNNYVNNIIGGKPIDRVVTSDTDSLFIQIKDLLRFRFPKLDLNNNKEVIPKVLEIASELQKVCNEHLNIIAKELFNIQGKHYFELKQEVILDRGYFAGKRRYAIHIVNQEGRDVDDLDLKGLDLMKSNMAPIYQKFGKSLILDIVYGKEKKEIDKKIIDFKTLIDSEDWENITKPTGVNHISTKIESPPPPGEIFSRLVNKCPINSKAAIYTNDLIRFKNLENKCSLFREGDKMRYVLLKDNPFKLSVIGSSGNDPELVTKLITGYIDREAIFERTMTLKLKKVYKDIGWGDDFPVFNKKINRFFKF
jgi:DNA polymerase elongation subunit (family B)